MTALWFTILILPYIAKLYELCMCVTVKWVLLIECASNWSFWKRRILKQKRMWATSRHKSFGFLSITDLAWHNFSAHRGKDTWVCFLSVSSHSLPPACLYSLFLFSYKYVSERACESWMKTIMVDKSSSSEVNVVASFKWFWRHEWDIPGEEWCWLCVAFSPFICPVSPGQIRCVYRGALLSVTVSFLILPQGVTKIRHFQILYITSHRGQQQVGSL